ncbi:peptidyl-prolyl cis-trans isomerase CYP57-like [Tripterygium wilfordii]|uniref:peptidyl-prolyl cis-trans isomerase CYP57-like n=1 Tax=Tripterygium wilfordii TaxID=458696 RepID=UPI0018F844E8|nr:peptidyl-prolyl cis-trans isomerase CYP57-like [Tripterygium wilfordii]
MSSVYVLEPPTKGLVILNTMYTIFDRFIKGFIVQSGDPTCTAAPAKFSGYWGSGDSIYNLLSLGEVETDKDDRSLDPPPRIKSVEVLLYPFEDVVPRGPPKPIFQSTTDTENKDPKKKAVKKLNLLSFGGETEKEEKELATVNDAPLLNEEIPIAEVDHMSRNVDHPNDYVVHDPLVEKGKENTQAKQKRREREWAGKSLT